MLNIAAACSGLKRFYLQLRQCGRGKVMKSSPVVRRLGSRSQANAIRTAALTAAVALTPVPIQAQTANADALYALIADFKSQNAELKELVEYQNELLALLRVDPASVWAARRPYSECLTSVLAEYCEPFGAMYLPPIEKTKQTNGTGEKK